MECIALVIVFVVVSFAFAMVFGRASRLGHSDERETPRKKPLEEDDEYL